MSFEHPDVKRVSPEVLEWISHAGLPHKGSYSVLEVAQVLSVSINAVYKRIADGRIRSLDLDALPGGRANPTRVSIIELSEIYRRTRQDLDRLLEARS